MAEAGLEIDPTQNVKEGLAEVLPVNAQRKDGKSDVFYNPAQVFNRDLSVLVLSVFAALREEEYRERREKRAERAEEAAAAAGRKDREKASAYALWMQDHRPKIVEELSQSLSRAPLAAEINKAIMEQWKAVNEAQKAIYEQRATEAKAKLATDGAATAGVRQKVQQHLSSPGEKGLKVLEALAATGIRTIRYAKELKSGPGGLRRVVANDLDAHAVEHMKRNFAHNGLTGDQVEAVNGCANAHMYTRRAKGFGGLGQEAYDVIDLDPYGTVAPFIDSAIQAVADGGLLCITSTDMPVLGGNHPETCFARYGGAALKAGYVHELALRLVLHAFATTAARYGREVCPLMCCSIDFYVRLFVRVYDSPARAKRHASKTGMVHQCVQCESFFVQKFGEIEEGKDIKFKPAKVTSPGSECPECHGRLKIGGPFHLGPLYNEDFLSRCLEACSTERMPELPGITSWKKITGLLTAMSEEYGDLALYYKLPNLCKVLKVNQVPLRQFRGTLNALGYRVSHFHREPQAIKTDAPNAVVFDLIRLWAEEHPPTHCPLPEMLKKPLTLQRPVEWKTEPEGERSAKVAKFLPNPQPNWGPKPRARSAGVAIDGGAEEAKELKKRRTAEEEAAVKTEGGDPASEAAQPAQPTEAAQPESG